MGKGRSPCCDKSKVKRGPWSPSEDLKLVTFVQSHGHANWRALPAQAGLLRCGKSCRLRWINYLRPDLKRGNITPEEEDMIIKLHKTYGNKWSKIASYLPGRTDNEIKNIWNTHIIKKLGIKCVRNRVVKRKKSQDSAESPTKSLMSHDDENDQYDKTNMSLSDIKLCERYTMVENENEPIESPTPSSVSCLSNVLTFKEHGPDKMDMNSSTSIKSMDITGPKEIDELAFQTTYEFDELDFWNTLDLDSLSPIQFTESEDKVYGVSEGSASSGFETNEPGTSKVELYSWVRSLEIELGLDA